MAQASRTSHDAIAFAGEIAAVQAILAEGRPMEDVWHHLRAAGFDMIDSKLIAMEATGLSAREAQRAVYLSDAWADMQPAVDRLQNAMIEAALSMGAEVRIDGKRITDMSEV